MSTHKIVLGFEPPKGLAERVRTRIPGSNPEVIVAPDDESLAAALKGADVLLGGWGVTQCFDRADSLKWIQTLSAGVEYLRTPEVMASGVLVTNASGAHRPQISEHILAMMLAFARDLPTAIRAQDRKDWGQTELKVFELEGKVLGIVGLGDLGDALASKARPLGMTVLALKNRVTAKPAYVDEIFGPEGLDEVLERSDFVADTLPFTPETAGTFGRDQFRRMKDSAYFFNVGRGRTVDQSALIEALRSGEIAGAGLDVTDPEPLPQDSPLWGMKNVIITYHSSGSSPHVMERVYSIFLDNLVRFHNGQPLANVVDLKAGY